MAIGVQHTSAALLALQTLSRLNDPSQSDQSGSASPLGDGADAAPSVISGSGSQALSLDSLGAARANLDRASSISDAALSAGQSVGDLLAQMKALVEGADGASPSATAVNTDFAGLLGQLSAAVSWAGFDGVNLLDGSSSPSVTVGAGSSAAVTLTAQNLTLAGPVITLGATSTISTQTAAADVLANIDASLANLSTALGQIGNQANQIQAHAGFVARLGDVLALGSNTAAPPTSADGARLMALQVQQQLATQGGAIANAAPQVLLSLFK
jgi:flagellin